MSAQKFFCSKKKPTACKHIPSQCNGETILLVEDEPAVREMVSYVLSDTGYQVIEAEDGPTALDVLRAGRKIDLLFVDLVLPRGMDGKQLAEQALGIDPGLKVLFTTGYSGDRLGEDYLYQMGAQVLIKPAPMSVLRKMVRETLENRRLTDE